MNNIKKIIIAIIVVILIIVVLIMLLAFRLNGRDNEPQTNTSNIVLTNEKVNNELKIKKIQDKNAFFRTDYNINSYYNYIEDRNTDAILSILKNSEAKIARNYTTIEFKTQEIYSLDKGSNSTSYVYGVIREKEFEDKYYLIINIDNVNNTFEIVNSSKEEFENAKISKIDSKYEKDITIAKNNYNSFKEPNISEMQIVEYYFDDYRYKALYKQEEAFNLIDSDYKQKKFSNDINEYKAYIQNNISEIENANITKYSINQTEGNVEYIGIDNYNNYYKIKEKDINNYTIVLDDYTEETEELVEKYNQLSDKDKATSILDKIFKLINDKDYKTLYGYLNDDFKKNYFNTQETFEKYVKENFFDNNILGNVSMSNEGNIFIFSVTYKESLSSAADEKNTTLNINLKNGTDFEFSIKLN